MYINNLGHMSKMAAMPIYGKNPSKIFSRTGGLISRKLGMKLMTQVLQYVYISCPCYDLDLFYGKVNIGCQCI